LADGLGSAASCWDEEGQSRRTEKITGILDYGGLYIPGEPKP